jgi:hypothetical protein
MALMAPDVVHDGNKYYPPYTMWRSLVVPKSWTIDIIIDQIVSAAKEAPGDHFLQMVIINAHGHSGWIDLGRMSLPNVPEERQPFGIYGVSPEWGRVRGRVGNIWIQSCNLVNDRGSTGKHTPDWYDGNLFCSALAKITGAWVVASSNLQPLLSGPLPWGQVNDWSGLVFRWSPGGNIDWFCDYRVHPHQGAPPISHHISEAERRELERAAREDRGRLRIWR